MPDMTDIKEQTTYRESGSEFRHPEALITSTPQGHESLFVSTLLEDKAILRVGAMGYRVLIKTSDKGWGCPSSRQGDLSQLHTAAQAREETKEAFARAGHLLSDEEKEALAAALEAVPERSMGAVVGIRLTNGQEPRQAAWLDPRWTVQARRQVRGR